MSAFFTVVVLVVRRIDSVFCIVVLIESEGFVVVITPVSVLCIVVTLVAGNAFVFGGNRSFLTVVKSSFDGSADVCRFLVIPCFSVIVVFDRDDPSVVCGLEISVVMVAVSGLGGPVAICFSWFAFCMVVVSVFSGASAVDNDIKAPVVVMDERSGSLSVVSTVVLRCVLAGVVFVEIEISVILDVTAGTEHGTGFNLSNSTISSATAALMSN